MQKVYFLTGNLSAIVDSQALKNMELEPFKFAHISYRVRVEALELFTASLKLLMASTSTWAIVSSNTA